MNILITGSKGFIGKELSRYFGEEHNVIATDRTTLDPTKYESVRHSRRLLWIVEKLDNSKDKPNRF